jgi:photosystem II stability/assembly factor-like uncharacterized protein
VAFSINSSGHIFAGASLFNHGRRDYGADFDVVFRSQDNGDSWISVSNGLTSYPVNSLVINSSDHIFTGTEYGILRSTDNGDNWTEIMSDRQVYCLAVNSSDHIFAGTYTRLFRSTDNGDNWIEINTGLSDNTVYCLTINSSGHIFVGTSGWQTGGIFRSTDNGDNWTQTGFTDQGVHALSINSSDHIFAGTAYEGIFRSTDNGDNWIQVNNGLTYPYINTLAINSNGHIFVGTGDLDFIGDRGGGVFRSTDNGVNWGEVNSGWTEKYVISLAFNSDYRLFAGTRGGGVFLSLSTTSVEEIPTGIPSTYMLKQNYPNPFNPTTKIKYQIPKLSFVTIKVYDVLGSEVVSLVNEEKPIGSYEVKFDGMGLPSGIYFYRLQAGSFADTKKMVLMK